MTMPQANTPTAKRLVLSLLSAPMLEQVEISTLLLWGELFNIDAATMRVTVGRLTRQKLLSSPARGIYCIGPEGRLLADTARAWLHAQSKVKPWDGQWLLVHSAHLGRSNKSALRARDRAFRLTGFAQWQPGLYCRPANPGHLWLEPGRSDCSNPPAQQSPHRTQGLDFLGGTPGNRDAQPHPQFGLSSVGRHECRRRDLR